MEQDPTKNVMEAPATSDALPENKIEYKVLVPNEVEELSELVQSFVFSLHEISPDYVFLNETSATPLGYAIKKCWKTAFPGDNIPSFYRIDPRSLPSFTHGLSSRNTPEAATYNEKLRAFLEKRITKKDPVVAIVDEDSQTGASIAAVRRCLHKIMGIQEDDIHSVSTRGETAGIKKLTKKEFRLDIGFETGTKSLDQVKFQGNIISPNLESEEADGNLLDYIDDLKTLGTASGYALLDQMAKQIIDLCKKDGATESDAELDVKAREALVSKDRKVFMSFENRFTGAEYFDLQLNMTIPNWVDDKDRLQGMVKLAAYRVGNTYSRGLGDVVAKWVLKNGYKGIWIENESNSNESIRDAMVGGESFHELDSTTDVGEKTSKVFIIDAKDMKPR